MDLKLIGMELYIWDLYIIQDIFIKLDYITNLTPSTSNKILKLSNVDRKIGFIKDVLCV